MLEREKVKNFLDKMLLKSTPAFLMNKGNVLIDDKSKLLSAEYPLLSNIYNEASLLSQMTKFCKHNDEFIYAEKVKTDNPLNTIFTTSSKMHVYQNKKKDLEHNLYFTRIMWRTEKLNIICLSVQQKEDFYEIIVKDNDIKSTNVENEFLTCKTFHELQNKLQKDIRQSKMKVYNMDMFLLQEITQREALKIMQ